MFMCTYDDVYDFIYSAEQENKAKLEKVAEIRRVTDRMVAIKR